MCRCTEDISELPDAKTKKDKKGKKKGRKLQGVASSFLNWPEEQLNDQKIEWNVSIT